MSFSVCQNLLKLVEHRNKMYGERFLVMEILVRREKSRMETLTIFLEEMGYHVYFAKELAFGNFEIKAWYKGKSDYATNQNEIMTIKSVMDGSYDVEINECVFVCENHTALHLFLKQFGK